MFKNPNNFHCKYMDYYSLLHVSPNFSDPDILKKNYKTLVLKYHPDKKPQKRKQFEAIVVAYKTLSDKNKRKEYDIKQKKLKVFLDTYFDLLSMFIPNLKRKKKSLDLFLTIENELPFDNSKLQEYMKKLLFQISTCSHHNDILCSVQTLLTSPKIQEHKRGISILKQTLNYVLSEIRRK